MIDPTIFASFSEEMEKYAAPWSSITGAAGKWLAPKWHYLRSAEKAVRSPTVGGAVTKRVLPGAVLGAGTGAVADKEDRLRGAMIGAGLGGAAGAVAPGALKELHTTGVAAGKLVHQPLRTLRAGWQAQSPVARIGTIAKETGKAPAKVEAARKAALETAKKPGMLSKVWHGGEGAAQKARKAGVEKKFEHLVDPRTGQVRSAAPSLVQHVKAQKGLKGKIKGTVEELSRRGWTGQGGVTKYMPVGGKAMTAGFAGMSAPTMYQAATGEVPLSEGLGEAGSSLGYLAAGAVPGLGMPGTMLLAELAKRGISAPAKAVEKSVRRKKQPTDEYAWMGRRKQLGPLAVSPLRKTTPGKQTERAVKGVAQAGAKELSKRGVI